MRAILWGGGLWWYLFFFSFVLHDPLENDEMVCKDPTEIPKSMGASPQHCTTHEVEIYVSQACRKSESFPWKSWSNYLRTSRTHPQRVVWNQHKTSLWANWLTMADLFFQITCLFQSHQTSLSCHVYQVKSQTQEASNKSERISRRLNQDTINGWIKTRIHDWYFQRIRICSLGTHWF